MAGTTNDPMAAAIIDGTFREEMREGRRMLFYQHSGRVAWLRFIPLLLLALIVTPLASGLLLLAENDFYYFFFVPLLISLPVMGVIYALVVWGRCRQPMLGAIAGCTLMMFFYLGYWQLSFMRFLSQAETPAQSLLLDAYMVQTAGRSDLIGYFILENRTSTIDSSPGSSKKEHDDSDEVFGYIFYGMEFIILAGIGLGIGGGMSGRVFLENRNRWAKTKDFLLPIDAVADVCRLIAAGDWAGLAKIPRVGAFGSQEKVRLTLRFELLPDDGDAPIFVTLYGSNLGKLPPELASIGKKGMLTHNFFKQLYVAPKDSKVIAAEFPELGLPMPREAAASTHSA
ncbi:hypothetical protein GC173_07055 [bacterium]|nr:hypothetical protein [bacterium]